MSFLESPKDLSNHILTQVITALACFNPQTIDRFNSLNRKFKLLKVVVITDPNVGDLRDDIEMLVGVMDLVY